MYIIYGLRDNSYVVADFIQNIFRHKGPFRLKCYKVKYVSLKNTYI